MPFFHRSILRVLMIFFLLGAIGLALPAEKVRSQGTATTLPTATPTATPTRTQKSIPGKTTEAPPSGSNPTATPEFSPTEQPTAIPPTDVPTTAPPPADTIATGP